MADVVIVRTEQGLQGLGEKYGRAYEKWRQQVSKLEIGETLQFSWRAPRSPKFHRLFFAMLGNLFDAQEQFADAEQLRSWLTVGAGYCDFVPGPTGRMVALPKSVSWTSMDDEEFRLLVDAVWRFLASDHATRFLWPMLTDQGRAEAAERILAGYEP